MPIKSGAYRLLKCWKQPDASLESRLMSQKLSLRPVVQKRQLQNPVVDISKLTIETLNYGSLMLALDSGL